MKNLNSGHVGSVAFHVFALALSLVARSFSLITNTICDSPLRVSFYNCVYAPEEASFFSCHRTARSGTVATTTIRSLRVIKADCRDVNVYVLIASETIKRFLPSIIYNFFPEKAAKLTPCEQHTKSEQWDERNKVELWIAREPNIWSQDGLAKRGGGSTRTSARAFCLSVSKNQLTCVTFHLTSISLK